MGKEYLIDTNAVIDYLDNKLPGEANELIDALPSQISVISRMELLGWSGATEAQTSVLEEFIGISKVFSLDEPIILTTIDLRKTHKLKLPDAIIAATALVNKLVLITRNEVDFIRITDLTILNPYELIV